MCGLGWVCLVSEWLGIFWDGELGVGGGGELDLVGGSGFVCSGLGVLTTQIPLFGAFSSGLLVDPRCFPQGAGFAKCRVCHLGTHRLRLVLFGTTWLQSGNKRRLVWGAFREPRAPRRSLQAGRGVPLLNLF